MIVLRTFGTDSNSAGSSQFVGIPVPVGTLDDDLLIVAIALPAAGITVTPPSSDWVQIAATDPTLSFGLVAFRKEALNEPANWVFELSAPVNATGAVAVYGGVDPFEPIEVSTAALTAASVTQNVPATMASEVGEELVLFMAAAASGTFTPSSNFIEVARKQQTGCTLELQHQGLQFSGPVSSTTETFTSAVVGAALLLVLRPAVDTITIDEARRRVIESFPRGVENIYDLTPTGDYFKYFNVFAGMLRRYGFGFIDLMRRELVPHLTHYMLSVWENVFGLAHSQLAKLGTIPQRQAQVATAWRVAAGQSSAIPTVEGVISPLLGYNNGTLAEVIECSRVELTAAHTYLGQAFSNSPKTLIVPIADGGKASTAGATLNVTLTAPALQITTLTLTGPDGTSATFSDLGEGSVTNLPLTLHAPEFIGKPFNGVWLLEVTNFSSVNAWSIFVEGVQTGLAQQETGAAIYDWGVYADPAHLGESGTAANFTAARTMLRKMAFSHTVVNLIQSLSPQPDTDSGVHAAIPDECIPT